MTRQYDHNFAQEKFLALLKLCVFRNNRAADLTALQTIIDNGLEAAHEQVAYFGSRFPFLLEPDSLHIFEQLKDKFSPGIASFFSKASAGPSNSYEKAKAYAQVILDEYERLLADYLEHGSEKTQGKLICLKNKLNTATANVKAGWINNLASLRMHFETDDLLHFRRARTRFFEPVYTTFEKNCRFRYFEKLIEIVIKERVAPMQWLPIRQLEFELCEKDSGMSLCRPNVEATMQKVEFLTRQLENDSITSYSELQKKVEVRREEEEEDEGCCPNQIAEGVSSCALKVMSWLPF